MPLWPFGRRKQRDSIVPAHDPEQHVEKAYVPTFPRNATPRAVPTSTLDGDDATRRASSQRKRRRSDPKATNASENGKETTAMNEKTLYLPHRSSVEDITALPGAKKMEQSPHLRPAHLHSSVVPYSLGHSSPAVAEDEQGTPIPKAKSNRLSKSNPSTPQGRRQSKRHSNALREEEIKAMSAPVSIPKRPAGHGDPLRRDSKKARRGFGKSTDGRGSNVSLPFQESIHSSMSGTSERRGWEVSALDIFNPRPTVKLAGTVPPSTDFIGGLSRDSSKKGKLPALRQDLKRRDRRKIADIADDLDASDLRELMERDTRRKRQEQGADHEKLERKLRKKAEKQRADDERREEERKLEALIAEERRVRALATLTTSAPIHPAFRNKDDAKELQEAVRGRQPPTPTSSKDERAMDKSKTQAPTYLRYGPSAEANQDPFKDPESSPFADPASDRMEPASGLESPLATPLGTPFTPMETPFEDPILETAQAVRFSQNRLSQASNSPPASPIRAGHTTTSPLRREYTPEIPPLPLAPEERRPSDTSTKRAGTWAQFFRRGGPAGSRGLEEAVVRDPEASFANTSRESMSRQQIPQHLIQPVSKRRSGTPVRSQSIFREDLPESPLSPPDSRVQSPDIIAAANVAAARRSRRGDESRNSVTALRSATPDPSGVGRTDSPVDMEGPRTGSVAAMSTSLASFDSEGSWLTGRPSMRKSHQSQLRSSAGSLAKQKEEFSASYEDLGMPEDQYFDQLRPSTAKSTDDAETAQMEEECGPTDDTLLKRNESRKKPTLVHRDPAVKSRQGLVADYQAAEQTAALEEPAEVHSESEYDDDSDVDVPRKQSIFVQAQNVEFGKGHARQLSSGSAKLLDIPPSRNRSRRSSPAGPSTPNTPSAQFSPRT